MNTRRIAIVGSGPAGLMAASQILLNIKDPFSTEVHLFEKRSGFGRKLLVAGSSGLNISHDLPLAPFAKHYEGFTTGFWESCLQHFGPKEWVAFINQHLEMETFVGTSQRWFVREMKASNLLKRWLAWLDQKGLKRHSHHEFTHFEYQPSKVTLAFKKGSETINESFEHVIFALGGGSWEDQPPLWPEALERQGLKTTPFTPANTGYEVEWPAALLKEAEGLPLKKVDLKTTRGSKRGELVITRYGLEGTPVYFVGASGVAFLDLKPDLSEQEILTRLNQSKENLSPIRRVNRLLNLSEAAQALIFHLTTDETKKNLPALVSAIKKFPIQLKDPRPLSESISSRGGLALSEINEELQLLKFPRIQCIGEMLDWHAPTGGFLIQACITQGAYAANCLLKSPSFTSNGF